MSTPNAGATSESATNTGSTTGFGKFPQFDMNAVIDSYKKNLEVLGLINKMSVEVLNGMVKLQTAFVQQTMSDLGSIYEKAGKPTEMATKFNEVTRNTVVKAVEKSKELSDMMIAATNDIGATVTKRVKDSIAEAKNLTK